MVQELSERAAKVHAGSVDATGYMDTIRDSIEDTARDEAKRLKELPVYPYPAGHARERGELNEYRASLHANVSCKEAIEAAIRGALPGQPAGCRGGGGTGMRFLLKILFAPILAVLAVITWFFVFVVGLSSGILCIPAAILGFFGLFIIFVDSVSYGAGLLVIAFLISPYGLPMLAGWLVAKLHVLRYAIQDRIYG